MHPSILIDRKIMQTHQLQKTVCNICSKKKYEHINLAWMYDTDLRSRWLNPPNTSSAAGGTELLGSYLPQITMEGGGQPPPPPPASVIMQQTRRGWSAKPCFSSTFLLVSAASLEDKTIREWCHFHFSSTVPSAEAFTNPGAYNAVWATSRSSNETFTDQGPAINLHGP